MHDGCFTSAEIHENKHCQNNSDMQTKWGREYKDKFVPVSKHHA